MHRRAWAVERAISSVGVVESLEDRRMLSVWEVHGDLNGRATDDVISVRLWPGHPTHAQVIMNGKLVRRGPTSELSAVRIFGHRGNDRITVDLGATHVRAIVYGNRGRDTIIGGAERDSFFGGSGNDSISSAAGDDVLGGQGNDDTLTGGDGADTLDGGPGNDSLTGEAGKDILHGGDGQDSLYGGQGMDMLDGGKGWDLLDGGDDADWLYGGADQQRDYIHRDAKDKWREDPVDYAWPLEEDYWHTESFDPAHSDVRPYALNRIAADVGIQQWRVDWGVEYWRTLFGATNVAGAVTASNESLSYGLGFGESDPVKSDGRYLYVLAGSNLVILDAQDPQGTHVISRTRVPSDNGVLYVNGSTLTVLSEVDDMVVFQSWPQHMVETHEVVAAVYDVSDPAAPVLQSKRTFDGHLSGSRVVDGQLYLVIDNPVEVQRPILVTDAAGQQRYETEAEYRQRVSGLVLPELPHYSVTPGPNGGFAEYSGPMIELPNVYMPQDVPGPYIFSVVGLSVTDPVAEPVITSVVGSSESLYLSGSNLYITDTRAGIVGDWTGGDRTDVHKFALSPDAITYEGSGYVPGWIAGHRILGSPESTDAIDEHDGYLRIATTYDRGPASQNIFVLRDAGDTLQIVSGLTEIAQTERLYAADFDGDHAYLATYTPYETPVTLCGGAGIDPLFAFDLSDPAHPHLDGVLDFPGYVSHLQPIGNDLLLGLGRYADAGHAIQGLEVSLFDVADPANPRRVSALPITQTASSTSRAEQDPKAFAYFPDAGILAVPEYTYSPETHSEMRLLRIDSDAGISLVGNIPGGATRAVRIGDYLMAIASNSVSVVSLDAPGQVIAVVPLQ